MPHLNPLPELIACRRVGSDLVSFTVTEDWQQGRTCYGGLISTLAVQAMRDLAGSAWPADTGLRGLQTCFVAPVSPGEVQIGVQLLRQGRNVCQVQAQALQEGQVAAVLLGVFGAERPSSLQPRRPARPAARHDPDALVPQAPRAFAPPRFLQHSTSASTTARRPTAAARASAPASICAWPATRRSRCRPNCRRCCWPTCPRHRWSAS